MTTISIAVQHDDPGDADRLYRQLRTELLALDVDDAEFTFDRTAPPLAKADPAHITAIVVALSSSPVLVQLGRLLRDWVNRANGRKIVVRRGNGDELEITGASPQDVQLAVESFFTTETN